MKKFIKAFLIFISFPILYFIVLTIGYLYFDPFKVLYKYENYTSDGLALNRDFVSTEVFIKNKNKYNYNSFIFGSSRTIAFRPSSWKKYLKPNDHVFMFDASSENIYGIYNKIKFLDSTRIKIDNALIIICRGTTFTPLVNNKSVLFIKHPKTSGESSTEFYTVMFKGYFSNPMFLFNYYCYKISGSYKPFMNGYIAKDKSTLNPITNETNLVDWDNELRKDPESYYIKQAHHFYTRAGERTDSINNITEDQKIILNKIEKILKKNNTKYKLVISPLYEQVKFSKQDINILTSIFGKNIYDFSGKNKFTDSYLNYYESSHYRPFVGNSIMKSIYN